MKLSRLLIAGILCIVALAPVGGHATPIVDTHNTIAGTDCTIGDETFQWSTFDYGWDASSNVTCATTKTNITVSFVVYQISGVNVFPVPSIAGSPVFTSSAPAGGMFFTCANNADGSCKTVTATGSGYPLNPDRVYEIVTTGDIRITSQHGGVDVNGQHTVCYFVNDSRGQGQPPVAIPGCDG
ncbi:MAG: hypothetical protein ACYDCC_12710 [Actinomycetota bacterium]